MEANNILFRCSQLGSLMTEPKSKTEMISETTKKYLIEVYAYLKYGRRADIVNKYVQKGLAVEEDSITLYSRITGDLFLKNEETMQNEFIKGTPDLKTDPIIDIKSSWDIFTFLKAKNSPLDKGYYWQLQGYMWLTGTLNAKLAYCLVNTPEQLINDQKRKFMWNANMIDESELSVAAFEEIERNGVYDDIPMSERLHTFDIAFNPEDIERLKQRIIDCRLYMQNNFTL
jgi:hypothetical protein